MSCTLVFSLAVNGYQHLFRSCLNSQYAYCLKNSYDYALITKSPWPLQAHDAAWLKVPLLLSASQLDYEWIVFLDADCEVRSFTQPIQTVFKKGKCLYLAPGISGRINSGVIIFKNDGKQAQKTFQKIMDNADSDILSENKAPYENGHFIQYIQDCDYFFTLEHEKWNNNSKLNPDSFVQHYSGKALRRYYEKKYITNLQRLSLKSHRYMQKITTNIPKFFSIESSTKQRLNILLAAYKVPLQSIITQSIR